jgi:hypothetical protein
MTRVNWSPDKRGLREEKIMGDPLARGAAKPTPTLGEGCTRRFDPDAMGPEHGTEFADAAALWRRLQTQQGEPVEAEKPPCDKTEGQ